MSQVNFPFEPVDKNKWIEQITKELKGQEDRMGFKDEVEEIDFSITQLKDQHLSSYSISKSIETKQMFAEEIQSEKESNTRILNALMQGANALFLTCKKTKIDWTLVFKGIQHEYIQTVIFLHSKEQFDSLNAQLSPGDLAHITLSMDVQQPVIKPSILPYFNGFELQQIGASIQQELAFPLLELHELLQQGSPLKKIIFSVGIGSNYYLQISKIKALHFLLHKLKQLHEATDLDYEIHARIGWTNKSLKDPYTNLLRQTTEAMSAYTGGIDALVIHPWDELSIEGKDEFSMRMSLNIQNILVEEAHFDWVADPMSGSSLVESLTTQLIEKTWKLMQKHGDSSRETRKEFFLDHINETIKKRKKSWQEGKLTLIGINAYENPFEVSRKNWGTLPTYLGIPYLIYETL